MHLAGYAKDVKARLVRAHAALDVAIDLNRRMIQELRPTLLDNFGLVAALKRHFTGACKSGPVFSVTKCPASSPWMMPV
jgi:signal transduction histidine kinase